jgi:hypothetical protein
MYVSDKNEATHWKMSKHRDTSYDLTDSEKSEVSSE